MKKTYIIPTVQFSDMEAETILALSLGGAADGSEVLSRDLVDIEMPEVVDVDIDNIAAE